MILNLPLWDFFKGMDKYPEYFDTETYWLCVFISLCLLALVGLAIWGIYDVIHARFDIKSSTKTHLTGELVDKRYVGEQSTSGSGTAIVPNSSGGVGVGIVSTSSHSDEEFLFFVKADKIYKIEVDMQQFYNRKIGDKLNIEVTIGGLTKKELEANLAN